MNASFQLAAGVRSCQVGTTLRQKGTFSPADPNDRSQSEANSAVKAWASLAQADARHLSFQSRFQLLHKPFGTQSCACVVGGLVESWSIKTKARRVSVPVAVRCIGGPSGTMTNEPPARPTILPSGVSRHVSPVKVYQASGPEWR